MSVLGRVSANYTVRTSEIIELHGHGEDALDERVRRSIRTHCERDSEHIARRAWSAKVHEWIPVESDPLQGVTTGVVGGVDG